MLVWLLGDRRIIRDDARIFFRRAGCFEDTMRTGRSLEDDDLKYVDSYSEVDPEEADHAQSAASTSMNSCP